MKSHYKCPHSCNGTRSCLPSFSNFLFSFNLRAPYTLAQTMTATNSRMGIETAIPTISASESPPLLCLLLSAVPEINERERLGLPVDIGPERLVEAEVTVREWRFVSIPLVTATSIPLVVVDDGAVDGAVGGGVDGVVDGVVDGAVDGEPPVSCPQNAVATDIAEVAIELATSAPSVRQFSTAHIET